MILILAVGGFIIIKNHFDNRAQQEVEMKLKAQIKLHEKIMKEIEEERDFEKKTRMESEKRRKESEDEKEHERKEKMKTEFTHWVAKTVSNPEEFNPILRNTKEFHRCKALDNINIEAFNDIVENMAKVLQLSDDRKDEIKLAAHSDMMVNVLEDFEFGSDGHYSYGKYQTVKRPNGNMDVIFALHAIKFQPLLEEELKPKVGIPNEPKTEDSESETRVATANKMSTDLSSSERIRWKSKFREEAMKTFQDDCPHQLLTDMGLKDQLEMRQHAQKAKTEKREKEKREKEEQEMEKRKREEEREKEEREKEEREKEEHEREEFERKEREREEELKEIEKKKEKDEKHLKEAEAEKNGKIDIMNSLIGWVVGLGWVGWLLAFGLAFLVLVFLMWVWKRE